MVGGDGWVADVVWLGVPMQWSDCGLAAFCCECNESNYARRPQSKRPTTPSVPSACRSKAALQVWLSLGPRRLCFCCKEGHVGCPEALQCLSAMGEVVQITVSGSKFRCVLFVFLLQRREDAVMGEVAGGCIEADASRAGWLAPLGPSLGYIQFQS